MAGNIGSAARAFDVLELVAATGPATIRKLAQFAGLPLSTTHRIVRDLADRGYVLSPRHGVYSLGPAACRIGVAVRPNQLVADLARPLLAKLAQRERVHAHLGVLIDEMVTYLVRCASGLHPIASLEHAQLEAYCSAVGKVLLAYAPAADLQAYMSRGGFVAITPATLTRPEDLLAELARISSRGWATDNEEIVTGLKCVAVPILDRDGCIVAAVSASASAATMCEARIDRLRSELAASARSISDQLGAHGIGQTLFRRHS